MEYVFENCWFAIWRKGQAGEIGLLETSVFKTENSKRNTLPDS